MYMISFLTCSHLLKLQCNSEKEVAKKSIFYVQLHKSLYAVTKQLFLYRSYTQQSCIVNDCRCENKSDN